MSAGGGAWGGTLRRVLACMVAVSMLVSGVPASAVEEVVAEISQSDSAISDREVESTDAVAADDGGALYDSDGESTEAEAMPADEVGGPIEEIDDEDETNGGQVGFEDQAIEEEEPSLYIEEDGDQAIDASAESVESVPITQPLTGDSEVLGADAARDAVANLITPSPGANVPNALAAESSPEVTTNAVVAVALGGEHSAAITSDGSLWTWGSNSRGQLGDGTQEDRCTPVRIMDDVISVALGKDHSGAVKFMQGLGEFGYTYAGPELLTWGSNALGKLGLYDGVIDKELQPTHIYTEGIVGVSAIDLGGSHTAVLKPDGVIVVCGSNTYGQLSIYDSSKWKCPTPQHVIAHDVEYFGDMEYFGDVVSVSLGEYHTAAVKKDGSLWTWGCNNYGQLGNGTTESRDRPGFVMGDVDSVSLGYQHSAAIASDGSLWMWGANYSGQLGDGTTNHRCVPTRIYLEDTESDVTLTDPLTDQTIPRLRYSAGSFYFNRGTEDPYLWSTTYYDCVDVRVTIPDSKGRGESFDVTLPDGLSFEANEAVTQKSFVSVSSESDGTYSIGRVYLLYSERWTQSDDKDFCIRVRSMDSVGAQVITDEVIPLTVTRSVDQEQLRGLSPAAFAGSNLLYNKSVALLSAYLSQLMENGNKPELMRNIMSTMRDEYGFSRIQYVHPLSANEEESVCATKRIMVGDRLRTLVVCAVQGSDPFTAIPYSVQDWIAGNCNYSGLKPYHENFMRCANNNRMTLDAYCAGVGLDLTASSNIMLVTGHSRGGAIANLVGQGIIAGGSDYVHADNVRCYTYAAANAHKEAYDTSGLYGAIYNITNYADCVPFVPGFGLDSYGHNYVFNEGDTSADDCKALMRQLYWTGIFTAGMRTAAIMANLTKHVLTMPMHEGIDNISWQHDMQRYIEAVEAGSWSSTPFHAYCRQSDDLYRTKWGHRIDLAVNASHAYSSATEHRGPVVWAMRVAANTALIALTIKCPVDVDVLNSSGDVVCSVVNDEIVLCDVEDLSVTVVGDQKEFVWAKGADYMPRIRGYADGTMEYSVAETDRTGALVSKTDFEDVPVLESGEIVPSGTEDAPSLVLSSGDVMHPQRVEEGDEVETIEVELTSGEEDALLFGDGAYARGGCVSVLASPPSSSLAFSGWYDNGTLVSTSACYSFFSDEDVSLEARFGAATDLDVSHAEVTLGNDGFTYTGEPIEPPVSVALGGVPLLEGEDFELEFANNVVAGTARVTARGIGSFVGAATAEFSIARARIEAPRATNHTYDGGAQTGVVPGFGYALAGVASATNAGAYKATATPDANHCWPDGGTTGKDITWTIARAKVAAPTARTGLTYSGKAQTGVASGAGYNLSGTASATKAGTYKVKATPDANHCWPDGGTAAKDVTWSIAKASQSVTAADKSVACGKTVSLGATASAGGKLTYKSSDATVATVDSKGTITGKKGGTAKVTVTAAATTNHKSASKTVTVTVTKAAQTVTAADKACYVGKTVSLGAKASAGGKLTYKSSDAAVTAVSAAGVVTGKKAGTAKVTVTAAATATHKQTTKTVTVTVRKQANTLAAKATKATVAASYSTARSKAVTLASNVTVSKAKGAVTYANVSKNATAKKFKVNAKTGKLTVPKGTKKGKYQVKVKVTAKGDATYLSGSKVVTFTVQVQ